LGRNKLEFALPPALTSYVPPLAALAPLRGVLIFTMIMMGTSVAGAQTASRELNDDARPSICSIIDVTAQLNRLPVDFFTRLIWQESHFQPDVIGPLTRSGGHAEGIAQFMPGTAIERGLLEPFDPIKALPKSGEFLAELRDEFGNLGLAAAAYNAGPQRVRDFLARSRDLPLETRSYVLAITGRSVEEWSTEGKSADKTADQMGGGLDASAPGTCRDVMARIERAPGSLARWQAGIFPSWCKGLRHPDVRTCGPVHLIEPVVRTAAIPTPRSHVPSARSATR
jgi:Transglycosylase SLT domain